MIRCLSSTNVLFIWKTRRECICVCLKIESSSSRWALKIHRNIVKIDKVNYYPATVHLVAAGGWIKQIKYEKVACYDDVSSFTKSPSNTTTLQQQQLPSSLNMFFFCIHSFASHSILTRSLESWFLKTLMYERVFLPCQENYNSFSHFYEISSKWKHGLH